MSVDGGGPVLPRCPSILVLSGQRLTQQADSDQHPQPSPSLPEFLPSSSGIPAPTSWARLPSTSTVPCCATGPAPSRAFSMTCIWTRNGRWEPGGWVGGTLLAPRGGGVSFAHCLGGDAFAVCSALSRGWSRWPRGPFLAAGFCK